MVQPMKRYRYHYKYSFWIISRMGDDDMCMQLDITMPMESRSFPDIAANVCQTKLSCAYYFPVLAINCIVS